MQLSLELDRMTTADKFLIMEKLWQDLSDNASKQEFSPKWHIDLLNDRDLKIKEGKSTFSSITESKKRLQKLANEN